MRPFKTLAHFIGTRKENGASAYYWMDKNLQCSCVDMLSFSKIKRLNCDSWVSRIFGSGGRAYRN